MTSAPKCLLTISWVGFCIFKLCQPSVRERRSASSIAEMHRRKAILEKASAAGSRNTFKSRSKRPCKVDGGIKANAPDMGSCTIFIVLALVSWTRRWQFAGSVVEALCFNANIFVA